MERIKEELVKRLRPARYEHVLRVEQTARQLAKQYDIDEQAIARAALLHDIAKNMAPAVLREILVEGQEDERLLTYHHELWHGPAGAILAVQLFGEQDEEVLNAVRYHTTGRAQMSDLEKVLFIADLIEPGRDFPGVEALRIGSKQSLDASMQQCIAHLVQYLASQQVAIFPDTIECYNDYMLRKVTATQEEIR